MSNLTNIKEVDDYIKLNKIIVSCFNKDGLVSNKRSNGEIIPGIPSNGLIGAITELNPNVQFISTGGTYKILNDSGYNVIDISSITKFPEMETGLVKSLHPAIHAGILSHKYTASDNLFMQTQGFDYIDAVIVNFYPFENIITDSAADFEIKRQMIDIGGPTMAHNARKAFVSTALIVNPKDYSFFISELKNGNGAVSLKTRFALAKIASEKLTKYFCSVNDLFQNTDYDEINCYDIKET